MLLLLLCLLPSVLAQVCTGSCTAIAIVPPIGTITAVIGNGPINVSIGYSHIAFHTQKIALGKGFVNEQMTKGVNISLQLMYCGVLDPNNFYKLPVGAIPHSPELNSEVMGINVLKGVIVPITEWMTKNFYTKGYTLQEQIPLQAYSDVSFDNEWYGIPWVADIRGININRTTFATCGLKLPPPLSTNWSLPYTESWNWYTFVNYTKALRDCGVLIPYWQIECTTHPFIMAIIQSFGGTLLKTDGTSNIMSDNVYKATADIIVPMLKYGGPEMICVWINCTAPGMKAYLENPGRDSSIPAYLGQSTCDIPSNQPMGMSMVTGGRSGVSGSATPGRYTPAFYWSLTMSKRAVLDGVQEIVWDWILFNSDFGTDTTFAYNYYKSRNAIPVPLNGRNKPFFQNLVSLSTTWTHNQPKGYSMLYPNKANEWLGRFEAEGRLNMYIACLSPWPLPAGPGTKVPEGHDRSIDYCRKRLHDSINYLALKQCDDDSLSMKLSECTSGGSVGFRDVVAEWDAEKLNISCRSDETILPTIYNTQIQCDYWMGTSSYSMLFKVISTLSVVIQVCAGCIVFIHRTNIRIKARSWVFSEIIFIGCTILASATYTFSGPSTDPSCATGMILFTTGTTLIFGSMTVKTYRIYCIFTQKQIQIVRFSDTKILLYLLILTIPHIIILLSYIGSGVYMQNLPSTVLLPRGKVLLFPRTACYYGDDSMLISWSLYWALLLLSLLYMTVSVSKEFPSGTEMGELYHILTERGFLRSLSYIIFIVTSVYLPMVVFILTDSNTKLVFTGLVAVVVSVIVTGVYIYSDATSIFFPTASIIGGKYGTKVSDGSLSVGRVRSAPDETKLIVVTSPGSPPSPPRVV